MADDVIVNKSASIERCVARAREEYAKDPQSFASDFTRQDAATLNIQRACEAALDMGHHLIRRDRLGVPQSVRDVFALLATAGRIEPDLAKRLEKNGRISKHCGSRLPGSSPADHRRRHHKAS